MKRIIAIVIACAFLSAVVTPQKAEAGALEGALIGAAIGAVIGIIVEVSKSKKNSAEQANKEPEAASNKQSVTDSTGLGSAIDTTNTSRQP